MPEIPERKARRGWALLALLVLYAATRLPGLDRLPPFLDETWHVRWSLWITEGQRLERPWNYGKGLSIYLGALLFLVSPAAAERAVAASRCLTVAAGAVTLWATVGIGRRLFGETAGFLAGLFYILCPFTLFYDRLALTDPFLSTFAALALLASIRLVDEPTVRRALQLVFALVLGILSKTVGVLLLFVPAAAAFLLRPARPGLARALALVYAVTAALVSYPLLRFFETTSTVRLGVSHAEVALLAKLGLNLKTSAAWLWTYWTPPLAVLGLLGVVFAGVLRSRPAALLAVLTAAPVLAFSAVSTLWFPRYLVFVSVPFLVLAAWGFCRLLEPAAPLLAGRNRRALAAAVLLVVVFPALRVDLDLWTDPTRAALPDVEREQFVFGWPSGYGSRDTVAFVGEELRRHPEGILIVAHTHSRRTTWLALGLAFAKEPRVELRDLDLSDPRALELLAAWAQAKPTLVVVSPVGPAKRSPSPEGWAHLGVPVARHCKPDGGLCDDVYRLCHGPGCRTAKGTGG
jgi:Dolichyl-phosphate-mannose-protein mannosyltransferase